MSQKPSPVPSAGPYLKTTDAGEALFLLLRAYRVLSDQVDREFREGGAFSLALWEVLVVLSKAPHTRVRMLDITRDMLVSKSNVTKLIDRLEEAGAVVRERSASDRRTIYARLTRAGIEVVERGGSIFNRAAREDVAEHLTTAEIEKLVSGLTKLVLANQPGNGERASSSRHDGRARAR